jgi:hypothetical protein
MDPILEVGGRKVGTEVEGDKEGVPVVGLNVGELVGMVIEGEEVGDSRGRVCFAWKKVPSRARQ